MPVTVATYHELFTLMARPPHMYLVRDGFPTTVAYIEGCDQGNAHRLLTGFRGSGSSCRSAAGATS